MVVQYYYPQALAPTRLDAYLSSGWFRNAYMMYRAKLICLNNDLYSIINIRLKLADYSPSKKFRKLTRRCDKNFTTIIRPMILDKEKEALYQKHKSRFDGFIYGSLKYFFYGEVGYHRIFNTYEICVYDDKKLIAVSFFDLGWKSCASLLGIFDQNYAKYSLGTYTMIKEVEFSTQQGKSFYYPGYVLDKSSVFDYKLRLGDMQYYNWSTKRWRKWQPRTQMTFDSDKVKLKMEALKKALDDQLIPFKEFKYPLFSVGYLDSFYVRSPIFIACEYQDDEPIQYIIEYWLDEDCFSLSTVKQTPFVNNPNMMEISPSFYSDHNYFNLLTYQRVLTSSTNMEDVIYDLQYYSDDNDFYDNSFDMSY